MARHVNLTRRQVTLAACSLPLAACSTGAEVVPTATPRTIDYQHTAALVAETASRLGVVGGQVAIFDGNQLSEFSTGWADREQQLPVVNETLFQIGSTTKALNAAIVFSHIDAGNLELDAPIAEYISDWNIPDHAENNITLRHLISMTSGLDNGPYLDFGSGNDALEKYVAGMSQIKRVFEPGAGFGYSNASTNISGLAIARSAGTSWETQLTDKIIDPLGLKHTSSDAEEVKSRSFAIGYAAGTGDSEATRIDNWVLWRSMAPAGSSLCGNAGDLVRFGRMFLKGGLNENGNRVLSEQSISSMQTPQITLPSRKFAHKWCLGPLNNTWDGVEVFGHSGTNVAGSSYLLWVPERNFAIATICNTPSLGYPFAKSIFRNVFKEYLNIEIPAALNPETAVRADVDLSRYVGEFEAVGGRMVFALEDRKLIARQFVGDASEPAIISELIPLGDGRFLPAELAMSGNRNWDVAFWQYDKNGRPQQFLNGAFPMRRSDL